MKIREMRKKLDSREIGASELTEYYLERIKNSDINSYITVCEDEARRQAENAQKIIDSKECPMLCGIPIAIKDNICVKGVRMTCGSKILKDFVSDYDADAVKKLRNAGAVFLGKTNMDEFAMGNRSDTSYFGAVKNPIDKKRSAGGSSGGSAAAVSAKLCAAALGSDTGGSVRQPAAWCGAVGLKPTYGRISRYGLTAFASGLEQIGIIGSFTDDVRLILGAAAGASCADCTSVKNTENDFSKKLDMKKIRIAVPRELFSDEVSKAVRASVMSALAFYEKCGCTVEYCSIPSLKYAVSAYYILSSAQASSNLSRFDGIRYGTRADGKSFDEIISKTRGDGFGLEVKRRILLGNYVLSSKYIDKYYKKALMIQNDMKTEYGKILKDCDFIISPSSVSAAVYLGETENPAASYLSDLCTVSANLTGLPCVSIPCGTDSDNMPIGMSITGRWFDEGGILEAADFYEENN